MAGVRRALASLAFSMLMTARAHAQSCHAPQHPETATEGFEFGLRHETAGFRTERYEGHYEGVFGRASGSYQRFAAAVSLPYYRILRNGLASTGLGDLTLSGRATLAGTRQAASQTGIGLAAMLPTGDSENDLGMGHVLLIPSAWARIRENGVTLELDLAYGRALATGTGHNHAPGKAPLVDPMNTSELEPMLSATIDMAAPLILRGGFYGGFPLGVDDGASRLLAFLGLSLATKHVGTGIAGHVPLLGDPFTGKLVLELWLSW